MNESKKPYASVGGTELSLWDITKILLAKIHWLLLAGVVVAAGVYAVVTIFVTPTYESRVSFYVYNSADNSSQGTINNSDLQAAESLATTYSKILASNSVLDSVLSDLRAETSLSRKELSRMVVAGHGLIQERQIGSDEKIEFEVSGGRIQAVHMLPGYTHNIINLSETENLVTVMWANEQFDPSHPDTYFEEV